MRGRSFLPFLVIFQSSLPALSSLSPSTTPPPPLGQHTPVNAMPSIVPMHGAFEGTEISSGVIKFTNCLLVKGNTLVKEDLWVSSFTGRILNGQKILYEHRTAPEEIVDLGGRILSPGLIDTQLNGAYGFDFSVIPEEGTVAYAKGVLRVNRNLVATGVTFVLAHIDFPTSRCLPDSTSLPRSIRLSSRGIIWL